MSYTVGASKSGSCAFTIPVLYVIELFVHQQYPDISHTLTTFVTYLLNGN